MILLVLLMLSVVFNSSRKTIDKLKI